MRVPLVHHDGSAFGFDIGSHTLKLAQLQKHGKDIVMIGYGQASFLDDTVIQGIITDPESIAKTVRTLLADPKRMMGKITAKKVICSLPVAKVFIRTILLPVMSAAELAGAVHLEAEQYIPIPISDLYLDFETIEEIPASDGKEAQLNVLMIAAPKAIVNSYVQLFDLLNLEIDSIEVSLDSLTRAMLLGDKSDQATLIMDFGSKTADIAIYEQVLRVTGSIAVGGDDLTAALVKKLGVTPIQANEMKFKFGVGPSGLQPKIVDALAVPLHSVTTEIKKVIKYYQDRSVKQSKVKRVVLSGGSTSMPGMVEYLNAQLGLPIIISNPWSHINTKKVGLPSALNAPVFTTAIGLALRGIKHD